MGGIAIIDLGNGIDQNPAPVSTYGDLYHALGGSGGQQNLSNRYIIINGGGEALGYSTQLHTQYNPDVVANHIKQGNIWIDYCGWPMYYQAAADGQTQRIGSSGWATFAEAAGFGWLKNVAFMPGPGASFGQSYPFIRGFRLAESLDGVCYSTATFTESTLFGGAQRPLTANSWTAMAALSHPSGGKYFYAVYTPEYEIQSQGNLGLNTVPRGVPISIYAAFIQQVVRGQTGSLTCQPYKTNTQYVPPSNPGPSSPTTVTSSPSGTSSSSSGTSPAGSGSSTSSGSSPTHVSTTSLCPAGYIEQNGTCMAPTPSPGTAQKVAGVLALLGGGGVLWYVGKQEGWWTSHGSQSKDRVR